MGVNASSCSWQLLYFGEQEVITGGSRELPIGFNKPRAVLAEARPDDKRRSLLELLPGLSFAVNRGAFGSAAWK